MLKTQIAERIKIFEQSGHVALKPYLCPKKKWTIGWGYNYQDRSFSAPYLSELGFAPKAAVNTVMLTEALKKHFTADMAERLLMADVDMVMSQCEDNFRWFDDLDDVRKATIADMCYQMGINKLLCFKHMLGFMSAGAYADAAREAKNSAWFKQSANRAEINVAQLRDGQWHAIK